MTRLKATRMVFCTLRPLNMVLIALEDVNEFYYGRHSFHTLQYNVQLISQASHDTRRRLGNKESVEVMTAAL